VKVICLHCVAEAAGDAFVPYFQPVIDALKVYLVNVETEDQRKVQTQAIGNKYVNVTVCNAHTHTQPFYGSVEFVGDNPGEPVLEETFTHSHSSWSSIIPICFLHLLRSMASSVFNPRALQSFFTIQFVMQLQVNWFT